MFAIKSKYFLIIENTKFLDLKKIKKFNKFIIIYRSKNQSEDLIKLKKFRKNCELRKVQFFVANNTKLAMYLKADGIYLSANNNNFEALHLKRLNFKLIGSAHNIKEIKLKNDQGCKEILFSKLFKVDYEKKSNFLGVVKFNKYLLFSNNLIPLGGIKENNLNSLRSIKCIGFAMLTEIKKKPAKIISRLF